MLPAQEFDFLRSINPFPVQESPSQPFEFAFTGGFNSPRSQFVDIDGDGDLDLFIQEQTGNLNQPGQLLFFENIGASANHEFQWRTDFYENIDIGGWYKFVDIDNDGDSDLIAESPFFRIRFYRNEGIVDSLKFVVAADTINDINGDLISVDANSIPAFADIDCDGDFDLFLGRQTGSITHYENVGLDDNGIPQFEFITNQFQDILIIGGGAQLRNQIPLASSKAHGANSLTFMDIDADQDLDLFWGDIFEPGIIFLENTGDCPNPDIKITVREYPTANPLLTGGFNIPGFADIDADNDYDMFVGVLGGVFSPTQNLAANFLYFQNLGSSRQPKFSLTSTQFISTLDIGANSIPAFVDIDNDGDLDLFLANEVDPTMEDPQRSHIYFFENKGTAGAPVLQLIDDDFLNLGPGFNYAPAFVDIDHDGDQDLFIGEWDGEINYYENTGSAELFKLVESIQNFGDIDVGNNNAPAFTDIDDDGDFDMFIGEFFGNINFYRNAGTASAPEFELEDTNYLDLNIGIGEYSYPEFMDLDLDGDQDLLVGSNTSGLLFFRNIGSKRGANFVRDTTFALAVQNRSTPALVDIDNDGDLDLFAGGIGGGLIFYENKEIVTSTETNPELPTIPQNIVLRQNYPNPFNAGTVIEFILSKRENVEITIYNIYGQEVRRLISQYYEAGTHRTFWNGSDERGNAAPSGFYIYRMRAGQFVQLRKLVLLR
ncbi:MAG: T9SS type A sorting domain-containing protein [bacterium]